MTNLELRAMFTAAALTGLLNTKVAPIFESEVIKRAVEIGSKLSEAFTATGEF